MAAVAIEVPDYGETMIPDVAQDCENTWTKPANDFIEYELADPQPVFLYYLRAGSMQAYHAAALNQSTTNIVNVPPFKRRFASRQPWPGRPAGGAFRCPPPKRTVRWPDEDTNLAGEQDAHADQLPSCAECLP